MLGEIGGCCLDPSASKGFRNFLLLLDILFYVQLAPPSLCISLEAYFAYLTRLIVQSNNYQSTRVVEKACCCHCFKVSASNRYPLLPLSFNLLLVSSI